MTRLKGWKHTVEEEEQAADRTEKDPSPITQPEPDEVTPSDLHQPRNNKQRDRNCRAGNGHLPRGERLGRGQINRQLYAA